MAVRRGKPAAADPLDWGALGRIAYTGPSPSGLSAVWLVDPDGTDRVMVHEGNGARWSRDGSKIAFVGLDRDLRIHAPGTAGAPVLAPGGEREVFPSWSPDGRSIAYVSEDTPTDWADYARSVSVSATRRFVRARVEVANESGAACAHTAGVRLQRRTAGEWSTVDKALTDEDGRVRWAAKGLRGTYRVQAPERYLGFPGDSSRCLAVTSPNFRLRS